MRPTDAPNDCRPGMPKAIRPCPWAACKFHLGVTRNSAGSIKVEHGHTDFERLKDTCAIDVARRGGHTMEQVADLTGITVDRIRQVERDLRQRLTRKLRGVGQDWKEHAQ